MMMQVLASNHKYEVEVDRIRKDLYTWTIRSKKTPFDEEPTHVADGLCKSLAEVKQWMKHYEDIGYQLPQIEEK
jgi:hypothetical protein